MRVFTKSSADVQTSGAMHSEAQVNIQVERSVGNMGHQMEELESHSEGRRLRVVSTDYPWMRTGNSTLYSSILFYVYLVPTLASTVARKSNNCDLFSGPVLCMA
jgi:hypothetical protein